MNTNPSGRLLRLPLELREKVYGYVTDAYSVDVRTRFLNVDHPLSPFLRLLPTKLALNHTLLEEIVPTFLRRSQIVISFVVDILEPLLHVKLQKGRPSCSCSMKVDIIDSLTLQIDRRVGNQLFNHIRRFQCLKLEVLMGEKFAQLVQLSPDLLVVSPSLGLSHRY
jgi:hypothetical protein